MTYNFGMATTPNLRDMLAKMNDLLRPAGTPSIMEIALGELRSKRAADTRADLVPILDSDLPDAAVIRLTETSASVVVDDDGNMLCFR